MVKEEFSCNFCKFNSTTIKGYVSHIETHKDYVAEDHGTIIGRGEKILVQILKEKLPSVSIFTQVHLQHLIPYEEMFELSQRQIKETIDVLILYNHKWIVFRVQDSRHQKGTVLQQADLVQKRLIQRYHGEHSVIDLRESECKTLFKNENNWYSQSEVGIICMLNGLRLE